MAVHAENEAIGFGRWTLDARTRRLALDGQVVDVGERAFDLLHALAAVPGAVVDTDALLQRVWPGRVVGENNLHVHMSTLRRLLGPEMIRTVRGRGYQLTVAAAGLSAMAPNPRPAPPVVARLPAVPSERFGMAHGNVPTDLPPLVGRQAELQALSLCLRQHRAVTVKGAAGVGKTRLACAAALASAPTPCTPDSGLWMHQAPPADAWDAPAPPAGGCWLVELSGAADGTPIAELVAQALGLVLPGVQAPDAELVDLLRTRALLLVLDNCEQRWQEAGRLVDALTRATRHVRLLATSQVPLQYRGEPLFRLGTLALPDPEASVGEARSASAVALFAQCVGALNPGFSLAAADDASLADMAAICRRLDGLPLAIELAAARVPLLGLAGLRQRLGQPLRLLHGGPHDAPARQQTLRGAIAWSHALLDEDERRAFRRLGVFAGSFSLGLAQQVLGDNANDDVPMLDLLQGLVDKSLVVTQPPAQGIDAEPRLRLLESTRAFALEQLQACDEQAATALQLVRAMLLRFERDGGPRTLDARVDDARLREPDLDNLRESLDWLTTQSDQAALHIDLAGASAWVWSRLGLRPEGLRRCQQALQRVGPATPTRLEARLQLGWASLVHRRGQAGDIAAAARAAALFETLGDRLGRFRALSLQAFMLALAGDHDATMAALEALSQAFDPGWGDMQWGAYNWTVAASLAQFDRVDEAMTLCRQSMRYLELVQHDGALAMGWISSAQLASMVGDFAAAVAHARLGLAAARRARLRSRVGMALGDLASYLTALGQVDEAVLLAREAVGLRAQDGTLGMQLDQLAQLACAQGRLREAAMALGRAAVHHHQRQGRRERYLQSPFQQATAAVSAGLPAAELQAWYARGAAMGDDEVARHTLGG